MAVTYQPTDAGHDKYGFVKDVELVKDADYTVPEEPIPTLAFLLAHGYAIAVES